MTKKTFKKVITLYFIGLAFFLGMTLPENALAGRSITVRIVDQNYKPNKLTAYPGDSLRICNESNYRRQPYTHEKYNRFGRRVADSFEMLKKGECREVRIQNPTNKWLKVTIRDAVAGKAK